MAWVRRSNLIIAFALINIFSVLLVVSLGSEITENIISFSLIDIEDKTEPVESQKSETQINEYHLNNLKSINLAMLLVSKSEFIQYDIKHSMEVFLEVVTPPPEA